MSTPRIRWGVLGTASIAVRKVIPGLQAAGNGVVTAIASRQLANAERTATACGIPLALGSYQALLDHPDIDAIYIPLPNHLHVDWSILALEAGKHVLCEKPIGLNAAEGRRLLAAAKARPHLKVAEAFMYRCHPRWDLVRTLVNEGAIGELRSVHTTFSYDNHDPANIRNIAAMGGGAWLDIGCYGVSVARWLFVDEPISVRGVRDIDPAFNTDRQTTAVLQFAGGSAMVLCATQLAPHQSVSIHGTTGRLELAMPFNPPSDVPTTIHAIRGSDVEEIAVPPCDQFTIQAERFNDAVLNDGPVPVSIEDAVANMIVLDRLSVM